MKVSCLQENLNRGLTIVGRVVPSGKALNPITQSILLEAGGGQLTLQGTDLATSATVWLDAKVEEPGRALVPFKMLADLVSTLAKDEVKLELDKSELRLKCGRSKAKVRGTDPEEFPVPSAEETSSIILSGNSLKDGVSVVFAAAKEASRPVLQGVLLDMGSGQLRCAATDGFRLAVTTVDIEGDAEAKMLIPRNTLSIVQQLIDDESVVVGIGPGYVSFQLTQARISSPLVQGTFPNYQQLIRDEHQCVVEVDREELLRSVRSAGTMPHDYSAVKMVVEPGTPGRIIISSLSKEQGEYECVLDATVSNPGEVMLNGTHLVESLQSMTTDSIFLGIGKKLDPVVLWSGGHTVVLMPLVGK